MEESMEMDVEKNADYYDRYSRQYFTFGKQAMNNLGKSNVFISGMGGLGVEIAKCVALAGCRSLTLHDTTATSLADLSTQFYLSEANIGQNRAACSIERLRELNPYVRMEVDQQDLASCDLNFLSKYNCVILTEVPLSVQLKVNQFCRSNQIPFIMSDSYGLFAWCFVDFGDHFVCFDKNGETEKQVFLGGINVLGPNEAEVSTLDASLHDLEDGDVIRFVEVKGMAHIGDLTFKIRNTTPTTFRIDIDTSKGLSVSGGMIVQVKQETIFQFKSLEESLKSPLFLDTDFSEDKFMSSIHVHYGMQALHQFKATQGSLPRPWNTEDAQVMVTLANQIATQNGFEGQVNANIVTKLSFTCRGNIIPVTATMGGFVAQEVVKGVSGKYSPLNQWLYFDGLEVVSDENGSNYAANFQPEGNRNDGNIICFGKKTFETIQNMKLFMVGAGAIGCEMIKNYAMLGLSSGSGMITITDNDIIEKSNLNRQFLFREKDIRSPKAVTAAKAALTMNPSLHITANCDKVCGDTEHIYTDSFFQSNNLIVNALDNVQARLYMDQRCVSNTRPLLESGTMGTKGHVQVILPHLTETYADTVDPPEQGFAYCLIHSFPSNINHTIFWARDRFHAFFVEKPTELQKFLSERTAFNNSIKLGRVSIPILKYIKKMLERPIITFSECVRIGRIKFERLFNLRIKQILVTYPPNAVDKDGKLFWTLPKRQPTPLDFDPNNEHHVDFLRHFSAILAHIYQIPFTNEDMSTSNLVKFCEGIVLPTFVPSQKTIITDESIKEKPKEEVDPRQYEILSNEVINKSVPDCLKDNSLRVEEFEKDDDFNHHVDFMTASSNLRALMYGIAPTDRMETKRIAGKIIPAIATTTTMVAGLVSLEIIKIAHGGLKVDKFKSMSLNLALPVFQMFQPSGPKKFPIVGTKAFYTTWDSWEVKDSNITLSDFCQSFQDKYNLTVTGVVQGTSTVYMSMFPAHRQRLTKKISDLLKDIGVTKDIVELVVTFEDEDGGDVDGPIIKFWNKHS